jgi:hypothetical protein
MHQYSAPAQRDVAADLYTTAGWVEGSFMLPAMRTLSDFANQEHDFFKLKDVRLPGLETLIPFFTLQRRSVILIVPKLVEESIHAKIGKEKARKDVSCAFSSGVVSGSLTVMGGVRVSDFMLHRSPFFYLEDCTLFLRTPTGPEVRRNQPMIVINRWEIIGVSEPRFV